MTDFSKLAANPLVLQPGRYTLSIDEDGDLLYREWPVDEQPYYTWLRQIVGGSIEYLGIRTEQNVAAYCYGNDDSRAKRLAANTVASNLLGYEVCGTVVVVVGISPDEDAKETMPKDFGRPI